MPLPDLNTLNDFRKLMLVYRLIHFKDEIADIDVNVQGREKELSKPIIQLFYGSSAQNEVEATLQYFLKLRAEKKEINLEPVLYPVVANLVSENGTEVSVAMIWEVLRNIIEGYYDEKKPNEYHTLEYGIIYNVAISNILEHTFGGRPKHRRLGNTFIFEPDELVRIGRSYNLTTDIQSKIIVTEENQGISCDDCEGSEGIRKAPSHSNDEKIVQKSSNLRRNFLKAASKEWLNEQGRPSVEASHPSPSSHRVIEDFSCYYCDYRTDSKDDYECHVISKHDLGHPCYPSSADIDKLKLKPQGKKWEI